jgi:tetratricopeptide (TPR) repeat protein
VAVSPRRTAILKLGELGNPLELRALDVQRLYPFELTIDGHVVGGGSYASPLGDQIWRDVMAAMGRAVEAEDKDLPALRRPLETVRNAGRQLYLSVAQLAPELRAFLTDTTPRRLVIMSSRAELHALPWEAIVDEQWSHPASTGLSIVHASDSFDPLAVPTAVPLTVRKIMGPGTERRSEPAIDDLVKKASLRRQPSIVPAVDGLPATIVHVEAHGDPWRGTIDLGQADFLDRQTSSTLVLLWSCVSNLMQPWGESLAMKLCNQRNRLVLGFSTEIRQDSAGELASRFYSGVFDGKPPLDPESALVDLRTRLYRERLRACEWASMTVWLRGAVDLGSAVLDGPRIPQGAWSADAMLADWDVVHNRMQHFAESGGIVVVPRAEASGPAPLDAAGEYGGVALHLRQATLDDDLASSIATLHLTCASLHTGDRLIAVVDGLAAYPNSLLLWTGVDQRAVESVRWLRQLPATLTFVLTSPGGLDIPLDLIEADSATSPDVPRPETPASDVLIELEQHEAAGEYSKVEGMWDTVVVTAKTWDPDRLRRLHAVGYWSFIRLHDDAKAEACLVALDRISPSEAALLRGNLAARRGKIDEARRLLGEAKRLAEGNASDEGRALLELANLARKRSDAGAEPLYRDALTHLEQGSSPDDRRWRSALGRALRDYADLLCGDERRLGEAEALLQRALINHALDGRMSQVATGLQTRGKLAWARGRFREAEDAIGSAAILQARFGNDRGWCRAMQDLAEVALEDRSALRARVLAEATFEKTVIGEHDRGRVAALAARACWQLGDLEAAARWSDTALESLAPSDRDARLKVAMIRDVTRSLRKPDAT